MTCYVPGSKLRGWLVWADERLGRRLDRDAMTTAKATAARRVFDGRNRPLGLVIAPGASADRDHRTLVAIEAAIPDLAVRRITLGTTSIARAVDKVVAAGAELADEIGIKPHRIAYGGRSFGGRACSVAVAQGMSAAGLALLSYPLHPPGKPDKLRVDHLPDIEVPTLFISGLKDPFGTPAEFAEHVPAVAGPTTVEWVPGNHSPPDDPVVSILRSWLGY